MNREEKRLKILIKLGFHTYEEYLKSPLWDKIKQRARAILGNKCDRCDQQAITFYQKRGDRETLLGGNIQSLIPVCEYHLTELKLGERKLSTHKLRNKLLREIGYNSYDDYLKSDLWKQIKERAFREIGDKCKICRRKADIFHHKNYNINVLLGEDLSSLVPLCNTHSVEFGKKIKKGKRRKLFGQANARLNSHFLRCRFCGKRMYSNTVCQYCRKKYATFLLNEGFAYRH